jgi:hypothetical protein
VLSGVGSAFTTAVASGPPEVVVPSTRSGTADSITPFAARAVSAAGETSALETRGADALVAISALGETGRRGIGIGIGIGIGGREGGGGDARLVPCTIGFVAGSDIGRSGESAAGAVPDSGGCAAAAAGTRFAFAAPGTDFAFAAPGTGFAFAAPGTGFAFAAAGLVGDEPTASFGSEGDTPGLGAGVFFIFTTFVGEDVSRRSFEGISCPSLLPGSRRGSSGSRDRADP